MQTKKKKPAKKGRKRQTVHAKLNQLNSRLNTLDKALERLAKRLDAIEKLATGNPDQYIAEARAYYGAIQDSHKQLIKRFDAIVKFFSFLEQPRNNPHPAYVDTSKLNSP